MHSRGKRILAEAPTICIHCREVIGVYEPAMVLAGGEARETSQAAEPAGPIEGSQWFHRDCYAQRYPEAARPASS